MTDRYQVILFGMTFDLPLRSVAYRILSRLINIISKGYRMRHVKDLGKFQGELVVSLLAWDMMMDGMAENCDEWFRLDGPFDTSAQTEYGPFTPEEVTFLEKQVGCIGRTDDNGFATFEWYEDQAELDRDWKELEQADDESNE